MPPLTRDFEAGQKSSKRVTVGGLSFLSLSCTAPSGDAGDVGAATRELLGKLGAALAAANGATKGDVAVLFLSAKGAGGGGAEVEAAVHRAVDAWTDGEQPPVRHVVVTGEVAGPVELQLMAVARAR